MQLMSKRDYYEVLSVSRNASDDELKASYRRLAMKYHPDRNPDSDEAENHFKEAKEAYEVLSDPRKRAAFDQFGHAGVDSAEAPAVARGSEIFSMKCSEIFSVGAAVSACTAARICVTTCP